MTQQPTKRSAWLSTIYSMLPNIDNDYAARLVYAFEQKKTIPQFQQEIADVSAQLNSDAPMTDTLAAKMLLDEITLPAALRQLRVYNNATSITELCDVLAIAPGDVEKLQHVYASFSSRMYFDDAFAAALTHIPEDLPDTEKALRAIQQLCSQAEETLQHTRRVQRKNRRTIFKLADRFHLPATLTAQLINLYTQPASIHFETALKELMHDISANTPDETLAVSLAARVLLAQLTLQDALAAARLADLFPGTLQQDDLITLTCRYLHTKTPEDVVATFQAVLQKLPHTNFPEENFSLAIRVLLDGSAKTFEQAGNQAALRRERELLRRGLAQQEGFAPYAGELAARFAGQKPLAQLERELNTVLQTLPYIALPAENNALACQVLLGKLSAEQAKEQAQRACNLQAHARRQALTPNLLANYKGNKTKDELLRYFETVLAPYSFWKKDNQAHHFALQTLVGELNHRYPSRITTFIFDMLENGSAVPFMADLLTNIQTRKTSKEEIENLLALYKQARKKGKFKK